MIRLASRSGTNNNQRAWDIGAPQTGSDLSGDGYSFVIDDTMLGTTPEFIVKWGSGNVGIGTDDPGMSLEVSKPSYYGRPAMGVADGSSYAYLLADQTFAHSLIWDNTKPMRFGTETSRGSGYTELMRVNPNGTVGIGDTNTDNLFGAFFGKLVVEASTNDPVLAAIRGIHSSGAGVWGISDSSSGVLGNSNTGSAVVGNSNEGYGASGNSTNNHGVFGSSTNAVGVVGTSANGNGVEGYSHTAGTVGGYFSNEAGGLALIANGRAQVGVLTITGGADLTESFEVSGTNPEPGDVVVIDVDHMGGLKLCDTAYDHKVAGIISGAGGLQPGLSLGQTGSIANGKFEVALTGRVYCKCDASLGVIEPGDLLTTSVIQGHAMKAVDQDRSHGAVIGKAMSSLESGRGLVLVLVNSQ